MPYITVIMPTTRVGGLDIVADGLKRQTFKDFQLIISDGIYQHRKHFVENKFRSYGINCRHIEPFNNPFFTLAYCRYVNTALTYADSEIVLLIADYTYLPPNCLETHANFHKNNKEMGLMSPHQYLSMPKLNDNFPDYVPDNTDSQKYADDLNQGKLNDMMWSIFEAEYNHNRYPEVIDPKWGDADGKLRLVHGTLVGGWFHCKNESCRLETFLDCNGFHEELDGTNCYQDTDMGEKLIANGHLKDWYCDPTNVVYIVNPRPKFPYPKRLRSIDDNWRILEERRKAGYPISNNWNLREVSNIIKQKAFYENQFSKVDFSHNFEK